MKFPTILYVTPKTAQRQIRKKIRPGRKNLLRKRQRKLPNSHMRWRILAALLGWRLRGMEVAVLVASDTTKRPNKKEKQYINGKDSQAGVDESSFKEAWRRRKEASGEEEGGDDVACGLCEIERVEEKVGGRKKGN
jgi:hypothetical protein